MILDFLNDDLICNSCDSINYELNKRSYYN